MRWAPRLGFPPWQWTLRSPWRGHLEPPQTSLCTLAQARRPWCHRHQQRGFAGPKLLPGPQVTPCCWAVARLAQARAQARGVAPALWLRLQSLRARWSRNGPGRWRAGWCARQDARAGTWHRCASARRAWSGCWCCRRPQSRLPCWPAGGTSLRMHLSVSDTHAHVAAGTRAFRAPACLEHRARSLRGQQTFAAALPSTIHGCAECCSTQ